MIGLPGFFVCCVYAISDPVPLSPNELSSLIEVASERMASDADVYVLRTITRYERVSRDEVEKDIRGVIDHYERHQAEKGGRKLPEGYFEKTVNDRISQSGTSSILLQHYLVSGSKYRLDQKNLDPPAPNLQDLTHDSFKELPQTFCVNGDPLRGDFSSFFYDRDAKFATRSDTRELAWKQEPVLSYFGLPDYIKLPLLSAVGKLNPDGKGFLDGKFQIDQDRVASLLAGSHPALRILKSASGSNQTLSLFEVPSENCICKCEFEDGNYRRPVKLDVNRLQSKVVELKVEYTKAESAFPQIRTSSFFDDVGNPLSQDVSIVVDAVFPDKLAEDLFQFNPPKDFAITDMRPQQAVTTFNGNSLPSKPSVAVAPARRNWILVMLVNIVLVLGIIRIWLKYSRRSPE